jgi:hypothetical protein
MTDITYCRLCKECTLNKVIDLGEQYITSRFPLHGDWSTPKIKISLSLCESCGLLQTSQTTNASDMYEQEYGYRSGINTTMRSHLKTYQEEILSKVILKEGDCVLDIGSNDSTMLQYYDPKLLRVGIDPTGKQFREYYGSVSLIADYFTEQNFRSVYPTQTCKVVSSISMFYDLPDPVQFARDIYEILDDEGIWTCEQSYLPDMLKTNSIDTICHEHLEYYSLHQIKLIADRANFKICDVSFNKCNGGSFRVYFAKKSSTTHVEIVEKIQKILDEEAHLKNKDVYNTFLINVNLQINKLKKCIEELKAANKEIWIYGASTKGNCLLQYANIDFNQVRYAVERNPNKVGKMTSTGIPIISEETMRKNPPAALLVLPWHFRDEIIVREAEFLKSGMLIFPFPEFNTVST